MHSHYADACIAIWNYRQVNLHHYTDRALWEHAWKHAWHLAKFVDAGLRTAIRHYLFTNRNWSVVNYDCGFTQN